MISERAKALLQAAATITAGWAANPTPGVLDTVGMVDKVHELLSLIEAREKAFAPQKPGGFVCTCEEVPGDHARCPTHGES